MSKKNEKVEEIKKLLEDLDKKVLGEATEKVEEFIESLGTIRDAIDELKVEYEDKVANIEEYFPNGNKATESLNDKIEKAEELFDKMEEIISTIEEAKESLTEQLSEIESFSIEEL